jgi:hypothetical protein
MRSSNRSSHLRSGRLDDDGGSADTVGSDHRDVGARYRVRLLGRRALLGAVLMDLPIWAWLLLVYVLLNLVVAAALSRWFRYLR